MLLTRLRCSLSAIRGRVASVVAAMVFRQLRQLMTAVQEWHRTPFTVSYGRSPRTSYGLFTSVDRTAEQPNTNTNTNSRTSNTNTQHRTTVSDHRTAVSGRDPDGGWVESASGAPGRTLSDPESGQSLRVSSHREFWHPQSNFWHRSHPPAQNRNTI